MNDDSLIPFEEWVEKNIGITWNHYIEWNSLIKAIPSHFLESPNENSELKFDWCGKQVKILGLTHKLIYEMLIEKVAEKPKNFEYIVEKFQIDENILGVMRNVYLLPKLSEVDNKKKEFQYKILNRYLAVNSYLKKINKVEEDTCPLCKEYSETIDHALFECRVITQFWRDFETWWRVQTKENIYLNLRDVILGYDLQNVPREINYFILAGKFYLFTSKLNDLFPEFGKFLVTLKKQYDIDVERSRMYNNTKMLVKCQKGKTLTFPWSTGH